MKHSLYGQKEEFYNEAQHKKQQIKQQKANGLAKQNDFIRQKRENARRNVDDKAAEMTG